MASRRFSGPSVVAPRRRLVAAALLAAGLAGCGSNPYEHGAGVYSTRTPTSTEAAPTPTATATTPDSSSAPSSPDLDQTGEQAAPPTGAQMVAAEQAARQFLAGYVPYTYAQTKASSIKAAHPDLLRQLTQRPPNVPPTQRRLHPKVTHLAIGGGRSGEVSLLASVDDGRQVYTIPVTVTQQRSGRWLVTAVS